MCASAQRKTSDFAVEVRQHAFLGLLFFKGTLIVDSLSVDSSVRGHLSYRSAPQMIGESIAVNKETFESLLFITEIESIHKERKLVSSRNQPKNSIR